MGGLRWSGADAADLFFAAVVQSVGPWGGRSAVRFGGDAAVCGIDLGREPVPDETTVCKFRHLLEEYELGERLFERVGEHLQQKATSSTGRSFDDSLTGFTKNARQERDPEMHQTRKGKQWYFGMKAHVGVDSQTKLIHSVVATAANLADSRALPHLLHGEETRVWGDQAYRGQSEVLREHAPHAQLYPPALSLQGPH